LSQSPEILPLLCGYFLKANVAILNTKYKEAIDSVYENKEVLLLMTKHLYSKAVTNTLSIYLYLDMTKNSTIIPDRVSIKIKIIKNFF